LKFGNSFNEVRETIKNNRIYINNVENFKISETCAFTVEARLCDVNEPSLPNAFFHFIVCFNKGEKIILDDYKQIFNTVGMHYMNSN
jgi:hypothetical protein